MLRVKIKGDQKVSVYMMITVRKDTRNVKNVTRQSPYLAADRQGQGDITITLTPSVIPNSN
jgi:hypothetical protein